MVLGAIPPDDGEIWLDGHRLDCLRPHEVAGLGVARTLQSVQIFGNMGEQRLPELLREMGQTVLLNLKKER